MYRYIIRSTGASSNRFGPCEVCKNHASEVFCQIEERRYSPRNDGEEFDIEDVMEDPRVYQGGYKPGEEKWTQNNCHTLYGHKECLEGRRRGEFIVVDEQQ